MDKKEKLKTEDIEKITYLDIEGKFLHIKVGDENSPASTTEINDIENKITKLFNENDIKCVSFVTHHAVNIDIIDGKK